MTLPIKTARYMRQMRNSETWKRMFAKAMAPGSGPPKRNDIEFFARPSRDEFWRLRKYAIPKQVTGDICCRRCQCIGNAILSEHCPTGLSLSGNRISGEGTRYFGQHSAGMQPPKVEPFAQSNHHPPLINPPPTTPSTTYPPPIIHLPPPTPAHLPLTPHPSPMPTTT